MSRMIWLESLSITALILIVLLIVLPISIILYLYYYDRKQKQHAILRNYPILGENALYIGENRA